MSGRAFVAFFTYRFEPFLGAIEDKIGEAYLE